MSPSPLAYLFGLGQGATALGNSMDLNAHVDAENRRIAAQDALARLTGLLKLGGQPVAPGTNPRDALQSIIQRNTNQSVLQNAPGAGAFSGGVDYGQYGAPQVATLPTATGEQQSFILDPSKTPEALAEQRAERSADSRYRQAMDVENAKVSAGTAAEAAKEAAAAKKALASQQSDYNTLKAEFPKDALVQQPFDPANAANYGAALAYHRQLTTIAAGQSKEHWVPDGQDKDGNPILVNTMTGDSKIGGGFKSAAGGGLAQTQQARLLAAVSEARLADERMRKFEDDLLANRAHISPLEQAAGSLTTNLTDTKSPFGALMQAGSELGLNKFDSDYAQYLRDAATIGRAEQMMSPRGGNETMVRANALLSRAGTGAMANTINASRMARQALFGQSGGIAQTLSPQQNQKLQQGVDKIRSGDVGGPQGPSGLTPDQIARAAADPEYAAFLRSQGKMP